ncbi:MAG: membrane protein insertase YidC [Gammaproteobacteria bacterium RIFCSPHIGHO2_12_FULL_42_10]|nr:MAG: membrane protein insertase YidC [Gammaproteobacteria bacterium RIFCSPHIGHO2_12_FULL_42_10]
MQEKILHFLRLALYAAAFLLAFLLFQLWEKERAITPPLIENTAQIAATPTEFTPVVKSPALVENQAALTAPTKNGQLITVHTNVLEVKIDTLGGNIVESKLLDYPASLGSKTPFLLMNDDPKTRYIAESGLESNSGPDTAKGPALYQAASTQYVLPGNQTDLIVKLTWQQNGIHIAKLFTFSRDSYEVRVAYTIANQSTVPWQGNLFTQLLRTDAPTKNQSGIVNLATYFGAAVSSPEKPFNKITFKSMLDNPLNVESRDGWAAMIQHYFITAWIPPQHAVSNYYSKALPNGLYVIGMTSAPIVVAPSTTYTTETKLYTGPAIENLLEKAAPALKLTIDYGWFWFISDIIFWMMQKIYDLFGNWGVSIILVTLIIKLLFYKLSDKSYRSMSKLKKLQPRIEALKERCGNDKQKYTQATLDLYRQEKVNPMGGCLPVLIQIPVFIALYWVLVENVQLRQAPFIFWIHDLSIADPYYVLPVLMGLAMFAQQRLNPPPPDPMQAKVMMFMPLMFTFLFANFPAGLMLYWFVNTALSFSQQWFIMHRINKETDVKAK